MPEPKKYYVNTSIKISSSLLNYGLMKKARTYMVKTSWSKRPSNSRLRPRYRSLLAVTSTNNTEELID